MTTVEEIIKQSDYLWLYCDDKKWCISKSSLIGTFDGTPICLSIIGFVSEECSINEYRFIHISPEYVDNFIKLLRGEWSIFCDYSRRTIPKIHHDFFGIDIVRENIIKKFFTNVEDMALDIISTDDSVHYSHEDLEYDLLGNKLSLIKLFNPMNIYSSINTEDILLKYSPDNSEIDILIKLFIMIDGLNEVFNDSYNDNYKMKTIDNYKNLNHLKINMFDFQTLKNNYSDETRIMAVSCRYRNLFYDIDTSRDCITHGLIFYMNLLAKLFGESIHIDEFWYNKSFTRYKNENPSNDDIKERRKRYVQKVKNIIDEFDDFFNIFNIMNESYCDYLSNF